MLNNWQYWIKSPRVWTMSGMHFGLLLIIQNQLRGFLWGRGEGGRETKGCKVVLKAVNQTACPPETAVLTSCGNKQTKQNKNKTKKP